MIYSLAGGGVPLNFKIVAYKSEEELKAAKPVENTIGVVTGQISGFVFSAAEPPNPVDDMLWIKVGSYSPGAFNALRKNVIQICPLYAKQYVSGAWIDVVAMNYLDGDWVEWVMDIILYDSGATDITLDKTTNVTDSGTYLAVSLSKHASGVLNDSAYARALVNLSGQKTLQVVFSNLSDEGTGGVHARVWDSDGEVVEGYEGKRNESSSETTITLDISALKGSYMVGAYASNSSSSSTSSVRIKSIKILMEGEADE